MPKEKPSVIDAEFEVVDGPYKVGDEHRERRGWYLTNKVNRRGEPLWWKPPGKIEQHILKWIWLYGIAAAILLGLIEIVWTGLFDR